MLFPITWLFRWVDNKFDEKLVRWLVYKDDVSASYSTWMPVWLDNNKHLSWDLLYLTALLSVFSSHLQGLWTGRINWYAWGQSSHSGGQMEVSESGWEELHEIQEGQTQRAAPKSAEPLDWRELGLERLRSSSLGKFPEWWWAESWIWIYILHYVRVNTQRLSPIHYN